MTWIQTFSGKRFDLLDPTPDMICIGDIAHSLAYQCRYNGHTTRHYSVAEHCLHMSHLVPREFAMLALMHDAVEAYVGDLPRPFKMIFPEWEVIEERIWAVISARFDLPYHIPKEVKDLDLRICLAEREQLMTPSDYDWEIPGATPFISDVLGMTADAAETCFLTRFHGLGGEA